MNIVPEDYRHSSSSVLNSPNNKKSVSGKFQPLFVTGGCKIMGQWFFYKLLGWLIFPHPARLHKPIDLKTFNKLLKESEVEVKEEGNPVGQELVFP